MSLLLGSILTYGQFNSNIEVGPTIPINGGKTIQKKHPFGNGLMVDYCTILVLSLSCCNYHALPLTIWLNTHTLCIEIPKINKPCRSFNHGRGRWWGTTHDQLCDSLHRTRHAPSGLRFLTLDCVAVSFCEAGSATKSSHQQKSPQISYKSLQMVSEKHGLIPINAITIPC